MKKLLAIFLAAAMAAAMAVTGLAAEQVYDGVADLHRDDFGKVFICREVDNRLYAANAHFEDEGQYIPAMPVDYGESVYMLLVDRNGNYISDSEMVEGLTVKAEYEQGGELVEYLRIVKIYNSDNGEYNYAVEMKILDKPGEVNEDDIIAALEFNKSKKGGWDYDDHRSYDADGDGVISFKVKDLKIDVSFSVGRLYSYYSGYAPALLIASDRTLRLLPNTNFVLKYDYDDEMEFEFGLEPNEGSFTVDVSGQGKTALYYNTNLDEAVAAANPNADIIALNFNGCKFHRAGVFSYESEKMNCAYAIRGGQLVKIGEFEDDVFEYTTRTLERYIFSDIELAQPQGEIAEMTYEVQW